MAAADVNLEVLLKSRCNAQAQITTILKNAVRLGQEQHPDADDVDVLRNLNHRFERFNEVHQKVLAVLVQLKPDEDHQAEVITEDEYTTKYDIAATILERIIEKASQAANIEARTRQGPSTSSITIATASTQQVNTVPANNLNQLQPDPFSGDRMQYRLFKGRFLNWVNKVCVSDVDKLAALMKFLRGPRLRSH